MEYTAELNHWGPKIEAGKGCTVSTFWQDAYLSIPDGRTPASLYLMGLLPLYICRVQGADAISQGFIRVGRDLLILVRLHPPEQTGQVLLPHPQLRPLGVKGQVIELQGSISGKQTHG